MSDMDHAIRADMSVGWYYLFQGDECWENQYSNLQPKT